MSMEELPPADQLLHALGRVIQAQAGLRGTMGTALRLADGTTRVDPRPVPELVTSCRVKLLQEDSGFFPDTVDAGLIALQSAADATAAVGRLIHGSSAIGADVFVDDVPFTVEMAESLITDLRRADVQILGLSFAFTSELPGWREADLDVPFPPSPLTPAMRTQTMLGQFDLSEDGGWRLWST